MDITNLLFSINGRIGRLKYLCSCIALSIVFQIAVSIADPAFGKGLAAPSPAAIVLLIAFTYINTCVCVKRAHDLDKSAWWILGWGVLTLLGLIGLVVSSVGVFAGLVAKFNPSVFLPVAIISGILLLVGGFQTIIRMIFFAGTTGNNRFGPPNGTDSEFERPSSGGAPSRLDLIGTPGYDLQASLAKASNIGETSARSAAPVGMPRSGPPVFGRRSTPAFR